MTDDAFTRARACADDAGLRVVNVDFARPWGGFLVLDDDQVDTFATAFLPDYALPAPAARPPMSPKLLVVAPGRQLSWQYHHRRAEVWSVVEGPVGVVASDNDVQTEPFALSLGHHIRHAAGTRHRLVGLDHWGIVAEIWEHLDPAHRSDEDDIVRLQDDFGR